MSGYVDRLERMHNADAWLAWHIAALPKAKRMPDLKSMQVHRRIRLPRKQSSAVIKGILDGLVTRTGGDQSASV